MEIDYQKGYERALDVLRGPITRNEIEIVPHKDIKELEGLTVELGCKSLSSFNEGEFVKFHPSLFYERGLASDCKSIIHVRRKTPKSGFAQDALLALASHYYRFGHGRKIAEAERFIDIGWLVRYHFDLSGSYFDEEGRVLGAHRVLNQSPFNLKLASFQTPWAMLTEFLAGRLITAHRSKEKLFFKEYMNGEPVPGHYREMLFNEFDFVPDNY